MQAPAANLSGVAATPDLGFVAWVDNATTGSVTIWSSPDGQAWTKLPASPKPASDLAEVIGGWTTVHVLGGHTVIERGTSFIGWWIGRYYEWTGEAWKELKALEGPAGSVMDAGDRLFAYTGSSDICEAQCLSLLTTDGTAAWNAAMTPSNWLEVRRVFKVGSTYVVLGCRLKGIGEECSVGYFLTSPDGVTWTGKWQGAVAKGSPAPPHLAASALWNDQIWVAGQSGLWTDSGFNGTFSGLWSVSCAQDACPASQLKKVTGVSGLAGLKLVSALLPAADRLVLVGSDKAGKAHVWMSEDGAKWLPQPITGKSIGGAAVSGDGTTVVVGTSTGMWVRRLP
jgi:hypothetical protein